MLQGKKAIITGARRGIGRKCVEVFSAFRADTIFACAREKDQIFEDELKLIEEKSGTKIIPTYFDLTDENQIKDGLSTIRKISKDLDILVNVAGCADFNSSFLMSKLENMKKMFESNFFGSTLLTQYVARMMIKNQKGSIVNVSSYVSFDTVVSQYEYAASKGAVNAAVKELSAELSEFGIRVNAVAPGVIDTDMTKKIQDSKKEELLKRNLLKRAGTSEEVANAVAFLASDLSSYITGQIIRVDGGM